MARPRTLRMAAWGGGGIAIGVAIAFLVLNIVARTEFGHERVLRLTLSTLGKSVHGGDLVVRRVAGNLFEGAKLYGVSIRDDEGQPFILADSAYADYDIRTLLSPRIHITRLTLYEPEIHVRKMPGDSLWNYQRIFRDTTPVDPLKPVVERAVIADTVIVRGARVKVETPWVADTTLSPGGQRRMVREALADTSQLLVRRVRGGFLRTMNIDRAGGQLTGVRFAPGAKSGSRFHIDSLAARVQFYRTPFQLSRAQGDLALFPGHVEFNVPSMRVNRSPVTATGTIRFDRGPDPAYDVALRSDSLAFGDLRWLFPRFPTNARASGQMLIETRPEGTRFDFRDVRMTGPGTRVAGRFGMVAGPDTLVFTGVNVVADPVRVSFVERMLPDGLPVRGLVLGGVTIRGTGPASQRGPAR